MKAEGARPAGEWAMTEGIEDALPLPLSMAASTLSVLPQFNLTTNHPIR